MRAWIRSDLALDFADEKLPAMFYYTAVWCGPCKFLLSHAKRWGLSGRVSDPGATTLLFVGVAGRMMAPVIDKLSKQYPKIPVYKVDIDLVRDRILILL
jgi:thioredoxin 1